jgi:hypothetical protein
VDGVVTGKGEGTWSEGKLTATASARFAGGRIEGLASPVIAEGIEADVEFTDLAALRSKQATVRVREITAGKVTLANLTAWLALAGSDLIDVTRVSAQAFGGELAMEAFTFVPSRKAVDTIVVFEGISAEEVMKLTEDLPARAAGKVSGRLPVQLDAVGLRLGTGWLGLQPGSTAEIQFNAAGLLTAGASPSSANYQVLQRVESGLLKLRVNELRLDIRPTDGPASRTARLHVAGEPVDPGLKAPVTLDLNVNGPLESLLNLGMKSGLKFGTKP